MKQTGLLIRAFGGFFDVYADDTLIRCRARGKHRFGETELLPGDLVIWEQDPDHPGFGILTEIKPRKNCFIRPAAANLDQLVFVASAARPATDPFLIDRMSVVAEQAHCRFLLCVNKTDLEPAEELARIYQGCGMQVILASAESGEGVDALRDALQGCVSALTGNSGVGKSSLINLLIPGVSRETAPISLKHGRGKHTTRHTELLRLPGSGWIADTPGFAALEVSQLCDIDARELAQYFPEFPAGQCRFPDCLHRKEPFCAVQEQVREGRISASRYQSYLQLLADCENRKRQ